MDDVSIFQIITAIVALLGFGLSLYSLYTQKKDKAPLIKVTWSTTVVGSPGIGLTSPQLFTTTAMNIGYVPVHLAECGILLPNGMKLHFMGSDEYTQKSVPATLLPGKSIAISRSYEKLQRDLQNQGYSGFVKINCYFRDEISNIYKSKKIKFWLNN